MQAATPVLKAGEFALFMHCVHESGFGAALGELKYFPAGQSVQTELPGKEPFPAAQGEQLSDDEFDQMARLLPQVHSWRGVAYICETEVRAQQWGQSTLKTTKTIGTGVCKQAARRQA